MQPVHMVYFNKFINLLEYYISLYSPYYIIRSCIRSRSIVYTYENRILFGVPWVLQFPAPYHDDFVQCHVRSHGIVYIYITIRSGSYEMIRDRSPILTMHLNCPNFLAGIPSLNPISLAGIPSLNSDFCENGRGS